MSDITKLTIHETLAALKKKYFSASELTLGEIEEYITNSYLDAIDEQTPGELNHEAAKRQIINHISEYLNSSEAFTQAAQLGSHPSFRARAITTSL